MPHDDDKDVEFLKSITKFKKRIPIEMNYFHRAIYNTLLFFTKRSSQRLTNYHQLNSEESVYFL